MANKEIFETIRDIIVDNVDFLEKENVSENSVLGDIMDEIELIDSLSEIEFTYDINISDDDVGTLTDFDSGLTVKDLINIVEGYLQ